jgi:4-hydroxyphenylpyruvate dioxygenase-like putative hemolysin
VLQIDSREKTSFMETSTFERAGKHIREGAWLYRSGEVEPVVVVDDEEEDDMKIEGSGDSNQE